MATSTATRAADAARATAAVVTPVGWGFLGAVVGTYALGVAAGYPMLVGLAVTAATTALLAAATVLVRPQLTVSRTVLPDRLTVGEFALGRLVARNDSRWPAPRLVAVERIDGEPLELGIETVAPGSRRTVQYPVPGARRGTLVLGPVTVERRDPLGLFRRSRLVEGQLTVWVRPRVHPLQHPPAGVVLDVEGQVRGTATAGTAAFSSLRAYTLGDDPRHIHWKQSARTGTLMVKEHVDADEPTVTVVLDARASVLDEARFEEAVEVAASFTLGGVLGAASRGRPATLRIIGENNTGAPVAADPLDRLAAARPVQGETAPVVLRAVDRIDPGGCVVVVTGDDDGVTAPLLSRLGRHALVVVISLRADLDRPTALPRPGAVVLRAPTAVDAVAAWRRLGAS